MTNFFMRMLYSKCHKYNRHLAYIVSHPSTRRSLIESSEPAKKIIAILFAEVAGASVDPMFPLCKTVGGGGAYFDVQFCMEALSPHGGAVKNYQDAAAVAVDLLKANATSTSAKIGGLLRGGGGGATAGCLRSCQALYGRIVQRQPGCLAAVKAGKFEEAKQSLETSASAAKQCEDGFGKSGVESPVTADDDNAFKLAKLAVALIGFA
ncbi:hypothetical protein ACP4OV_014840 [Aristida adscensionis]